MEYPINSPEWHFQQILHLLGHDIKREGLIDTPKRYVKFLKEFFDVPEFNMTVFTDSNIDEMIIQKNIPFYSLCEHHTAPFFGTAAVAYVPNGKILGLSKLSRVVDKFAHDLQNQERITTQIAEYIDQKLEPKGVAVSIKARHLCMEMRGVKKHDTFTITNKLLGIFKSENGARSEFFNSIDK